MPCDVSTCAIDIVNSSLTVADATSRNENERIVGRKKRCNLQSDGSSRVKNRYSMAPARPVDITRNLSAVCSPSSSSSSSSTSSGSSSASSSSSSSCYDNPRQIDTTNSSASLILILERSKINNEDARDNGGTNVENGGKTSSKDDDNCNFVYFDNVDSIEEDVTSCGGFSERVTTSSIENLAKKKVATPTSRCRRRRSTASPRNNHNRSKINDDKIGNSINVSPSSSSSSSSPSFVARTTDDNERTDFVATSTLMKNNDFGPIAKSKNSSATKFQEKSLMKRDEIIDENFDLIRGKMENMASRATLTSQQPMISVAAIRGTNIAMESRNNNNNKNNNSDDSTRIESKNARRTCSSVSFPSAYNKNNNNNNNNNDNNNENGKFCQNQGYAMHSKNSRIQSLPVISANKENPSTSKHLESALPNTKKTTQMLTTSGTKFPSTVRSSSSLPYVLSSETRRLSAALSTVDFAKSLKTSSSFTAPKATRINRNSRVIMSLHASLGQLPILTSSSGCAVGPETIVAEAAIFENFKTINEPLMKSGEEAATIRAPTTIRSIDRTSEERNIFSDQRINDIERIIRDNDASSSFAKSPLRIAALPTVGNPSSNVANAFKNNLVASGYNNNNNNQRCNHSPGTSCTCSGTATTSQTSSSTLTRSSIIVSNNLPNSALTNNSVEQETDYVVDPVQGNAYHKGQFLGKGGFARVYLMTDVANGNQYACKIIPKNRMQKIHIQKIAREIMIHKELNHVNVVQMHHYFEDNINVYMLLEPCPRKSLMHVLKYRGKVTEPEARYYMRQMVTGVAYIHSQKVVHRDLKPGNMFLSDGMIVKIGDFGLARRPDGQRRRVTICGTPNYIAPEVLYKQAYSYEADVWALGCILYALLAGQPPFDTSTLKETYARICNNRYKKLDDSVVSRSGQDLIRWLLQPIPELRPSLERVKEHPYLTMEYVPTKLSHTCCYRVPISHSTMLEQSSTNGQQTGISANSLTSPRGLVKNENCHVLNDNGTSTLSGRNANRTNHATTIRANFEAAKIQNSQKKPKVGNWLFRKLPKLPGFRQRLTKFLCPENKKPDSLMMHRAIESCLAEIRYTRAQENPMLVDRIAPLFVTKWIDYSNKYGLGFQLSDRSVGVLFNDSTKMSYTHDRRRVEYATTMDEVTRYRRENDVPSCMEEKLELLRHFTHYMDNFLTNGGEVREQRATKFSRTNSSSVPRMKRWLRTDKAIVMELTVPLLQVNFFVDHSKIVVSEGSRERGYLVTYIDASRQASSYWLNDLRDIGCTADLYERLSYVSKVIGELENDGIFDNSTNPVQHRNKTLRT